MKILGKKETTITISTGTIIKAILFTVLAFVLINMMGNAAHQIRLIFISFFLALALNPAVTWITSRLKSKSRIRATGAAYLIVVGLLIGFLIIVVPPIVNQSTKFVRELPQTINDLKYQDSAVSRTIRKYKLENKIDELRDDYAYKFRNLSIPIYDTAGRVGGTIVSIITVLVLTFMMLVEAPLWVKKFMDLQPDENKKAHRADVARRMYRVVTGFVNGQVLIAAIAAMFACIVLFILNSVFSANINPIAMAGIVFVFGLIPLIGNILASVIVVLVCLLSSFPLAVAAGVYFLVYQQIENATLQPYIQSRNNQLTPLTVFIVALVGAGLAGLIGALAAIPIAGCAKILLDEYINVRFPSLDTFKKNNVKE